MLTSLFRRSVANSRSLNVAAFRSVHSMTFRAAVGNTNNVYGGAFQSPSFLQSECVGVACVQRYSPSILSPTLSKIFARGFKTQLKKPKTKLKTKKAAKKRFILTGRGKLKRNHSGKVRFCVQSVDILTLIFYSPFAINVFVF
jgi:hypothetical protein